MKLDSFDKLYLHELKDLYNAENQLLKALPKMAKKATSPALRKAIEAHIIETKQQVGRLDQIFEGLGVPARGKKCEAMAGLIEEAKSFMEEDALPEIMDAGIIASAQRAEHYEIAAYGSARTFARLLGRNEDAELLQQTLDEEGKADKKLTAIAESVVNPAALRT
ncbi:MAG: ferritin-like domain-containing protein [Phycisphaerales bacterium]|nr:ferritin-like domain-containing protein [Phycisphaerales bacterium]